MFGFFSGVPAPQCCHARLGGVKPAAVAQCAVGKYGGAVLVRSGNGQQVPCADVVPAAVVNAAGGPVLPAVDQALRFKLGVVLPVNVAVRSLLANELGRIQAQLGAVR